MIWLQKAWAVPLPQLCHPQHTQLVSGFHTLQSTLAAILGGLFLVLESPVFPALHCDGNCTLTSDSLTPASTWCEASPSIQNPFNPAVFMSSKPVPCGDSYTLPSLAASWRCSFGARGAQLLCGDPEGILSCHLNKA